MANRISFPKRIPLILPGPKRRRPRQAVALAIALVEASVGHRPLHQVRRLLSLEAFEQLTEHRSSRRYGTNILRISSFQLPSPNSAEVVIRLATAAYLQVCTLRLELSDGSWMCTDFSVLGPRSGQLRP
ncbi:Rv3235 family protein [Tessaracoccus sp. OH4464_COT-324]|uniref:Rv3235 family protein n=1 Tax=Tessaracoccus sp. OH4464_COT-324 TaxID=2491059 RepID=UPI000F635BCE|nr:Rv3235 family protein [Tessaracoccus sp. OH4464_COT-324]RRD47423.1 hypothetical protein EII42_02190 [Tessaracoccus sp. OH4464_COT-324]